MPSTIAFNLRGQGTSELAIDLYEAIGSDPLFGGGISAKAILDALAENKGAKKVRVRINSAGGIVTEGLAIYNALRYCKAEVTCQIDSLAGSIASIIAMAGRLEMAEHSYLMIHNPYGAIEGGSGELRHQADVLDSMREQMIDIYAAKSGQAREFIGSLMDDETWITPTQALAWGFCDALIPEPKAKLAAHFDLSEFRNTPRSIDSFRAAVTTQERPTSTNEPEGAPSVDAAIGALSETAAVPNAAPPQSADKPADSGAPTMDEQEYKDKIAELEARLAELEQENEKSKAEEDESEKPKDKAESEEDDKKAETESEKAKAEGDEDDDDEEKASAAALIAHVKALTGHKSKTGLVGALEAHLAKTTVAQTKKTVAQRVSALIAAGKIRPHRKSEFLKMSVADLDVFEKAMGDMRVLPVGEEHTPDENAPEVVKARANTAPPVAKFDPESVQLDASEATYCKARDPHGTEKFAESFLAQKRADAKAAFEKTHGRAAA